VRSLTFGNETVEKKKGLLFFFFFFFFFFVCLKKGCSFKPRLELLYSPERKRVGGGGALETRFVCLFVCFLRFPECFPKVLRFPFLVPYFFLLLLLLCLFSFGHGCLLSPPLGPLLFFRKVILDFFFFFFCSFLTFSAFFFFFLVRLAQIKLPLWPSTRP